MPEGRGTWAETFFDAASPDAACAQAMQRDLRHVIERFRKAAEAIPDGVVVLDARNRIEWANPRAQSSSASISRTIVGQPLVNLLRQPEFLRYLESGDYREPIIVASSRDARRTLALQLVPFGVRREAAAVARRDAARGALRACGATSSPTSRTSSRRR